MRAYDCKELKRVDHCFTTAQAFTGLTYSSNSPLDDFGWWRCMSGSDLKGTWIHMWRTHLLAVHSCAARESAAALRWNHTHTHPRVLLGKLGSGSACNAASSLPIRWTGLQRTAATDNHPTRTAATVHRTLPLLSTGSCRCCHQTLLLIATEHCRYCPPGNIPITSTFFSPQNILQT